MRKVILSAILSAMSLSTVAQEVKIGDVTMKAYGQIRADLFYNTRANNETVDGLFYMYPKDNEYDADGNDLNAMPQGSLYAIYSRLGVDVARAKLGSAAATAKIEADFRGSGTDYSVFRIRHAYFNLNWDNQHDLLVGQTWHPLFGEVSPSMLNLSTGAPFQPFSRAPQIRYRYSAPCGLRFSASAIWQFQYTSAGPEGKTHNYLKNSNIPELHIGVDYRRHALTIGASMELLSLKPRTKATFDDKTYKVKERVTSLSAEFHLKYQAKTWFLSGKTILANNLTQCSMLGGFGVIGMDTKTGEYDYTPFRHSMTWVNFVYGEKWQYGLFAGYLKNLGTGKAITGPTYGVGLDVDQIFATNWQVSYNIPHWKFGIELEPSTAWYGAMRKSDGRIIDTHHVTNLHVLGVAMFIF